ncbi:peptidoglycan DD-metalloendopeptidase family protein [Cytobacillus sp. IB215665]|uniref:peptidoglycan DD-metalloendopeptidase family protein n=1 Tax=Cytobacillus sp. IB215665 TaxID=3097357 RepID=UPI002A185C61|nr:peptidoglycan DD-metalloendopeptidase family protein [Cytobacillus sp. IB215665]MDX8367183.1 peptidoglycan DD-metalloendopeptidase family protein [Cytobacillus sp. IB215665]
MDNHNQQQDPHSLGKKVASEAGNYAKRKVANAGKKIVANFFKKVVLKGIKALLIKTAPIWGSVLLVFILAWLGFMMIYAFPRTVAEDVKAGATEQVEAFFGFSEMDLEGFEDVFETYDEVASRWDEGLTQEQKAQAAPYELRWGVLAGVDRMRNDPHYYENMLKLLEAPEELLESYYDAESTYGIPWHILAGIHYQETMYEEGSIEDDDSTTEGRTGPLNMDEAFWEQYGVDGDGDGESNLHSSADAISSLANYLDKNGFDVDDLEDKDNQEILNEFNEGNSTWNAIRVLDSAEMIKILQEIKDLEDTLSSEEIEELMDSISKDNIYYRDENLITPKPEETFDALRPYFTWKDSTITRTWEEEVCFEDPETGIETCTTVTRKSVEEVSLLVEADTYEGLYEHIYEWQTLIEGKYTVVKEVNTRVIPPADYLKPFYDYLASFGVTQQLDKETTINIIKLFDTIFEGKHELRESLITDNYPRIEAANGWIWPTISTRITSGFGPRPAPCSGCSTFHDAIDIGAVTPGVAGDPIFSIADGTVIVSKYSKSAGNMVTVDHGDGIQSRYIHMLKRLVSVGDTVTAGDIVGTMGTTGYSTGVHLDLQIKINGKAVDPRHYLGGGN